MGRKHGAALGKHLTAIADPNIEGTYRSVRDMLDSEKLDGVIIASPSEHHFTDALTCINLGIPVLIEKPLVTRTNPALFLANLVRNTRAIVKVGHIERFHPDFQKLRDESRPWSIWSQRETLAVGSPDHVAMDLAIHDIDLINVLSGQFISFESSQSRDFLSAGGTAGDAIVSVRATRGRRNQRSMTVGYADSARSVDFSVCPVDKLVLEQEDFFNAIEGRPSVGATAAEAASAVSICASLAEKV